MTIEELTVKLICMEQQLRKQNFRLYLLEKGKDLRAAAREHKKPNAIQLDFFETSEKAV